MSNQRTQNYENHTRWHVPFHFVLSPLSLIAFIAAIVNLIGAIRAGSGVLSGFVLLLMAIILLMMGLITRFYATRNQDRVIRMEENFRHHLLTGKVLDPRISMGQIVALRFASNEEFPGLAAKAAESGMAPAEIKKAIKNWRADHQRV
jgi:hypothetical protein